MVYEESRIKFDFPDSTETIKFDDTVYYRNEFNALPRAKGVDFIAVDQESITFLEVKNCIGDEGNCRWRIFPNNSKRDTSHTNVNVEGRDSLDIEVAEKVAMTLAALAGIRSFGSGRTSLDKLRGIADSIMSEHEGKDGRKKYVVLFLEGDFGGHTRTKKMIMMELQRSLNAKMRWFNCRVSVEDSDTYSRKLFSIEK
jgi:hypothetical protein